MSKITDVTQKLENVVVKKYLSIEDKFVDLFLKKSNETIEEAKKRLKEEQEKIRKTQQEMLNKSTKYTKSTDQIQKEINEKYHL